MRGILHWFEFVLKWLTVGVLVVVIPAIFWVVFTNIRNLFL